MGFSQVRRPAMGALAVLVSLCTALPLSAQQSSMPASPVGQVRMLDLPEGARPVPVKIGFHLLAIHAVDDEAETFRFSGVLKLQWQDSRQAFDPSVAKVSEMFYHGNFQFNELSPAWYPQVMLANATEFDASQGVLLRVKPDGTCTLIQPITAEAKSELNLRRYPFDRQNLKAVFEVLGFDEGEVKLSVADEGFTADLERIQIPQWDLVGIGADSGSAPAPYARTGVRASEVTMVLDMKRQSFFMVRLVLMPLGLIVLLSWSVFWMDRSSLGDRMSVSFVGILTAVAYQIMLSDIMPQIAYVTLMNSILNFSFIIMCATVVINLRVGALDKRGDCQRGERLDLFSRRVFPLAYAGMLLFAFIVTFYLL